MFRDCLKTGLYLALLVALSGCGEDITAQQYFDRAQLHAASGEIPSAIIELKSALQSDGRHREARFLLGTLYFETGDILAARKELERARDLGVPAAELAPWWSRILLAEGGAEELLAIEVDELTGDARTIVLSTQALTLAGQGDLEAALTQAREALAETPDNLYVRTSLARIYMARGERTLSREQLESILEIDTDHSEAWLLTGDLEIAEGRLEGADLAYGKAIDDARLGLEARLRRAFVRIQVGSYDGAREDVDALIAAAPHHPGVNYAQGVLQYSDGELQEAVTSFAVAERDKVRYPRALFYSGTAHFSLGNLDQATGYANQFHSISPDDVPGRKLLAAVLLSQKNPGRAEELIRPVVVTDPSDVDSMNLLANALMGQGKTEEGIEMLSRVAALQPESSAAQIRLGAGLLMLGDSSKGVEMLETAVELNPEFQQADILLVLNYLGQQDFEKALEASQAYRSRNPAAVTPLNLLGRVHIAAGDEASAREAFTTALEIDPGEPNAHLSLAAIDRKNQDFAAARAHYQAILDAHSNHLRAMLELAELDGLDGDLEAMVGRVEAAVEANPDSLEGRVVLARAYLATGKPERVAVVFSELDDTEKNVPMVLNELARAQLALGDYAAARYTLDQLSRTGGDSALLHHQKAMAAAGLDRPDELERELRKSLEAEPNFIPSRIAMVRLQLSKGDLETAQQHLDKLIELAPEFPGVLLLQAQMAQAHGNLAEALGFSRRAFEITPTTETLFAVTERLKAAGKSDEAVSLLEDWLGDHPDDVAAQLSLAASFMAAQRIDEVLVIYRRVLELDDGNLVALNNLAWYLLETEPEAALSYARRAAGVAPDSPDVLDTLALAEYHNGDAAKARRTLGRALETRPEDGSLLYHQAMLDAALGDREAAKATLQRVLARTDDFPERSKAEQLLASL
jgi:putative PEP-CTERM system TPR-repeat lipoprotein